VTGNNAIQVMGGIKASLTKQKNLKTKEKLQLAI